MKNWTLTKRQHEWLWFAVLWCGGLAAALMLGGVVKLVIHLMQASVS